MLFKEKVTRTITRNALPGKDTPILIVLSGGADSVALLRVMLSLGYTCEAAHCNLHLRGKESERDEAFVRALCEKFHIKLQADIMRNKTRLEVLPLLRGINPSVDSTLHREAGRLRETMSVYKWGIDNILKTIKGHADGDEELAIRDIPDGVSHEAVLYEWLYPRGFNETQVLDIMEASSNDSKVRFESCEYLLILEQGVLYLANKNSFPGLEPSLLPDEGETNLWNGRKLSVVTQSPDIPFEELKSPCNAFLDAGKLKLPLKVRAIRNGDRFVPFGMKGSKLVSDYLADRKVPWLERMRQLVVTDNEKIVWLVGQRVDDRVKVTPETKETICLRMR